MRTSLGIGTVCLAAASLFTPAAVAQSATPRVRTADVVMQRGVTYLGIAGADVTSERARSLGLKEERGVEVTHVGEDSPASKAGIKVGDVVLEYNGQAVQGIEQLTRLIRETPAGRQVKVAVWRSGAALTLTATPESHRGMVIETPGGSWVMPEVNIAPMAPIPPMPPIEIPKFQMTYQSPMLGIQGESLGDSQQLADFFGVKDGVLVRSVGKGSVAEKAGIKAGDVIVKVDDSRISTTRDITSTLRALRPKTTVTVTVVRNKREIPLTVTFEGSSGRVRASLREIRVC
jgi:serine protease Do